MESCLYVGRVRHRRFGPVEHGFDFPLFMLWLDLGELDRVFRGRWLWSTRRPALARFRREDHLGDPALPLDEAVRRLVADRIGRRPEGAVRLLTHLRYAGFVFNPLSLFYCHDAGGGLEAVVADVSNTPWNERHRYVLPMQPSLRRTQQVSAPKAFHVSPFLPMGLTHVFTLGPPGERLGLRIEDLDAGGRRVFAASLALRRREITGASLALTLLRFPLMTLQVVAGIYWQALRLRRKGAPFFPHPKLHASAAAPEPEVSA